MNEVQINIKGRGMRVRFRNDNVPFPNFIEECFSGHFYSPSERKMEQSNSRMRQ